MAGTLQDLKPLPLIIRQKAERILNQPVALCFRVEENNANLIKCIMVGVDRTKYVDLLLKKEVNALSIQIVAEQAGKEDTNKLVGDTDAFFSYIPEDMKDENGIANEVPSIDIKQVRKESNRKQKQLEHKTKIVKKTK